MSNQYVTISEAIDILGDYSPERVTLIKYCQKGLFNDVISKKNGKLTHWLYLASKKCRVRQPFCA